MLESAWLFVGCIAFLWTMLTLLGATIAEVGAGDGDGLVTIGGVVGFVLWGVWTFGTLNIEALSNGTTVTFSNPALTILGVALALVPGYLALTGPIELVARARNATMDDL